MSIRDAINASLSSRATFAAQCRELGRRGKAARVETVAAVEARQTERLMGELFPSDKWEREAGGVERKGRKNG
jgi:hypothetical protein